MRRKELNIDRINYKKTNTRFNFLIALFIFLIASILIEGHMGVDFFNKVSYGILLYGALIYIASTTSKLFYEPYMLIFCIIIFLLTVILSFSGSQYFSYLSAFKGVIFYCGFVIIAFIMSSDKNNEAKFWKIINTTTKITLVLLLIQSSLYFIFQIRLHEFPIIGEWLFKAFEIGGKYRPCAIFSEPSHLAEFVLLSFYYSLFIERNFKLICFYSLGLIITTSGLGIIGGLLLWIIYIFTNKKETSTRNFISHKKGIRILIRILVIFVTVYVGIRFYVFMLGSDNWLLQRLASGGTIDARVYRSFDIFGSMNTFEKIFGVGIQNQANYLNYNGIISVFDNVDTLGNREYAQTLGYILCTTGIIGCTVFIFGWVRMFFKSEYVTKCLIAFFLFICLVSNVFTRYIMILYMVMIYNSVLKNKRK